MGVGVTNYIGRKSKSDFFFFWMSELSFIPSFGPTPGVWSHSIIFGGWWLRALRPWGICFAAAENARAATERGGGGEIRGSAGSRRNGACGEGISCQAAYCGRERWLGGRRPEQEGETHGDGSGGSGTGVGHA